MPNILESLSDLLRSFVDEEPKPPIHVGEVMSCWTYMTMLSEAVMFEQMALNMTTDPELKDFLEKTMAGASMQERQLTDFLQKEGIPLPPVSEPKPLSDPNGVPFGAKLNDNEIANWASVKLASTVSFCAAAASQCVRNDIAVMFIKFQHQAMSYGMMVKTLMRKRGWIKIPPYFLPPGAPGR